MIWARWTSCQTGCFVYSDAHDYGCALPASKFKTNGCEIGNLKIICTVFRKGFIVICK